MLSYEEAIQSVKDYALEMNGIIRSYVVSNGGFALVGHFIAKIYNVSDEKVIEDLTIEKNGTTYKLIEIDIK